MYGYCGTDLWKAVVWRAHLRRLSPEALISEPMTIVAAAAPASSRECSSSKKSSPVKVPHAQSVRSEEKSVRVRRRSSIRGCACGISRHGQSVCGTLTGGHEGKSERILARPILYASISSCGCVFGGIWGQIPPNLCMPPPNRGVSLTEQNFASWFPPRESFLSSLSTLAALSLE